MSFVLYICIVLLVWEKLYEGFDHTFSFCALEWIYIADGGACEVAICDLYFAL